MKKIIILCLVLVGCTEVEDVVTANKQRNAQRSKVNSQIVRQIKGDYAKDCVKDICICYTYGGRDISCAFFDAIKL